jgi:hypothetical protein
VGFKDHEMHWPQTGNVFIVEMPAELLLKSVSAWTQEWRFSLKGI